MNSHEKDHQPSSQQPSASKGQNVNIFVRVRPPNSSEDPEECIEIEDVRKNLFFLNILIICAYFWE